ncbi:ExeM/NucH family extracellular endonuclease [Pseudoalteromonas sp. S16_S37]|uniref:ExeM/NucH family extracellular endonuclease n=1 Tax=Pseudoalteromonas sp. S16_S37 TaxID=2720228 RepID=UPI0016812E9F|nr:ExeM/NucH family extracellular endonuclease [Pseudoalteromonas sp. S16_S37]MBD1583949.1 ExeM/NucH family extracellular endonuclease [Pseudoalteromonas sp. S16_S37]
MLKKTILATLISAACLPAHAELIISEYVEGSSYNKAVELYNTGDQAVNLADYGVNFYFNGSTDAGRTITLEGSLESKSTFVIAHASASEELTAKAQLLSSGSWFNGDDAIALLKAGTIIDSLGQIGVDPGYSWADDEADTKDKSLVRKPQFMVGDANASDEFVPSTQWIANAKDDFSNIGKHSDELPPEPEDLVCDANNVLISQVQGADDASPLAGQTVEVQGVVTSALQGDEQLKGFFLQEELADQDNDPLTSEGIFVYFKDIQVNNGDIVKVAGKVEEKYGQTQLSSVSAVKVCGSASVPATTVTLPLEAGLESVEGMLVEISNALVVNDTYGLKRYGEIRLGTERLYQSTQVALPGDAANAVEAQNKQKEILLDDGSSAQNPEVIPYPTPELDAYNTLRLGDTVTGVQGVLGYGFSQYRIHPTTQPSFVATNPRTDAPEVTTRGDLRIASFNVLNYFNGDGQGAGFPTPRGADKPEEFERQKAKTVAAMLKLDADLFGILEMENDGFGELSAIADLTAALNAQDAQNTYAYVNLGTEKVGGDAIMSAIIYRSNKVKEVGTAAFTEAVPFDYGNRPPVMQTFTDLQSDETFNLVVAHLRSKGSCTKAEGLDQDQQDGQGCWNLTRVNAVKALSSWLATSPTGQDDPDTIILGDMNAYGQEDPIRAYVEQGYQDIKKQLHQTTTDYSYVYQGRIGSLDHAFASSSMMEKVVDIADWHINADEPVALDYNMEYKSDKHLASLYADNAYRASDHDPIVIELKTKAKQEVIEGEFTNLAGWFWWQRFSIELPEGYKNLEVSISGEGEADLYVRHNKKTHFFKYDCRPYLWGSEESCSLENPQAGTWHFGLRGIFPYANVTLKYKATK